ncbi:MAG: hypothetical protein RL215_2968, partial [Planctomycetota bacterium]
MSVVRQKVGRTFLSVKSLQNALVL